MGEQVGNLDFRWIKTMMIDFISANNLLIMVYNLPPPPTQPVASMTFIMKLISTPTTYSLNEQKMFIYIC